MPLRFSFAAMLLMTSLMFSGVSFGQTASESVKTPLTPTSQQPLEISADQALEWDRTHKKYTARGHAIAKQNDFQVEADTLVAEYREGTTGKKKNEIYRLTAEGHVILTNGINKGYGDHAIYEVDVGKATMTGGDLRIESPQMKVTAQDKFEYYSNEGKMIAYGAPILTDKDTTLTADQISAWIEQKNDAPSSADTAKSKLGNLKRAEAIGNVVIRTPKEKATADKATYTGETDLAELTGHVKLYQGENILEGVKADMNMTTKVSHMYGNPEKGGRVKGVFFPSLAEK